MKKLTDIILTVVVLGGILAVSALFTHLFVKVMYYRCSDCRTINAKRRTHCRSCGNALP